MKPSPDERMRLVREIQQRRREWPATDAELGRAAHVHASQVGRICRGEFRTFSANVVQVCRTLGLAIETPDLGSPLSTGPQEQLATAVSNAWDKTDDGALRLARVIDAVGVAIREQGDAQVTGG